MMLLMLWMLLTQSARLVPLALLVPSIQVISSVRLSVRCPVLQLSTDCLTNTVTLSYEGCF